MGLCKVITSVSLGPWCKKLPTFSAAKFAYEIRWETSSEFSKFALDLNVQNLIMHILSNQPHPAIYVICWFCASTALIFSNRYILIELDFPFPVFLTTWHLTLATVATRLGRRYTRLLDGVAEVEKRLTWRKWATGVLPIGLLFSGSLVCSNYACKQRQRMHCMIVDP